MPPVLRRTLSAPAARLSAAPYTRRSGTTRRRVLGDLAGEQLIAATQQKENNTQSIVENVPEAEVAVEAVRETIVEDVPLASVVPAVPALVTGLAALSLAPQTPTRRRTLRREPSLSPSLSSLSDMSAVSSRRSSLAPLDAPDFGTPESSPRRTRSRRARALQRTLSEPLIPSTPSRRRRLARTSSLDTISDENAPIIIRDLFN